MTNKLTKHSYLFTSIFIASILAPTTAQAGSYYNCTNPTGCKLIESKNAESDYTQTKYPVVMAHGTGGWTRMFGLVDYFHKIPQDLIKGGSEVYATKTAAINTSENRGEQLLQQVKTISAITGKTKVNLIGHSHGGHDIRYVAAVAPEYVASVTAVASPEQGSKMADWIIKMMKDGSAADGYKEGDFNLSTRITLSLFNFVGNFMEVGSGISLSELQKQDGWATVNSLSTDYMKTFNAKFPAAMPTKYCGYPTEKVVNGIPYYSFSGVNAATNIFDPSDYMLKLTTLSFGDNDPNDGLVSSCSSRLGYVIRDNYNMNHLDSMNQLFGMTSWSEASPVSLYRMQVNRLKSEGL